MTLLHSQYYMEVKFWRASRRVSSTPLVQVPPGWGARSKGRVGVGMVVGAVPAIAPRARTSTGSAASKHDQHPGFAGVQRPLKALSSEQLLNGWLYYYKNCGITCVK